MDEPKTLEEWRAAANAAETLLLIDSARQYGLIAGGPEVNVERCVEILRRARERSILPTGARSPAGRHFLAGKPPPSGV